tara:strand:+ start:544 stop:720 length:177 start_codon:yes stop_codon:yes gene_type:complete
MISTVTNTYDMTDASKVASLKVVYQDGTESFVPLDEGNRHYKEVLQWVADGNEIGEPE